MGFKYGEDGHNPFRDLKQPEYNPEENDLKAYFSDKSNLERKVEVLQKLLAQPIIPKGPVVPLTDEEAEVTEEIRQAALSTARRVQEVINKTEQRIDDLLAETNPSFSVTLDRKPKVRRAIKDVFGNAGSRIVGALDFGMAKPTTITYEMYKRALKMRNDFHEEESSDIFQD